MARLSYETAETLVYDPVPANRTATRAVLFTLGFRNIETVATVAVPTSVPPEPIATVKVVSPELSTMSSNAV